MASSSSSPSRRRKDYHVFLSFRGKDVRNNFLGHLYDALDSKGFNAYKDDLKLRKGEEITPALMDAIEGSHLAIVVLSENYAESPFCLRELTKVMECKELKEIVVLPVFFKVEPREVRGQSESYGRAMARHEKELGLASREVAVWREALRSVGTLAGWHIQDGDEAELVRRIVKAVSSQLYRPPLDVVRHPVGIDARVEIVASKLESQSKDVSTVGIWGTGGVGKTTIAKAVYNSLSSSFGDRCFIADVRERSSHSGGMIKLQQQLLSQVLREKDFPIFCIDEGIGLIKDRLCYRKVLLVLDDVDKSEQLDALAGRGDWFGKGTRIIITTRDRHLLTYHGIDREEIFTVEGLCHKEALELFCCHAFPRNETNGISDVLVNRVLDYAKGLPLVLVVLGSSLVGRSEAEWQSAIERVEKTPNKTIIDLLKISFDGLEESEKEIFLDIACFLRWKSPEYVLQVLNSCGYDTIIGLARLEERCLIRYPNQMHDLLQLMAMDIVRHQNPDNPGMRSRLCLYDDVVEVLSGNQGTNTITGIVLILPEPEVLLVSPDAFRNLRRLRLLILHNVNLLGGPVYLPDSVRWLELDNCSIPNLGFNPGSKKLVSLYVQNSSITRLESQFANFRYLKSVSFANCLSLVLIPDLSTAPNLETLDLLNCRSLMKVDQSVGRLGKLVDLNLRGCSRLTVFPDELTSEALRTLNFTGCSKLKKFPEIATRMQLLFRVGLERSGIEELPNSIENLISMETFNLTGCKNLASIPHSIYKLEALEILALRGCSQLKKFPYLMEDLTDPEISCGCPILRILDLGRCGLCEAEFFENEKCFPGIRSLKLRGNKISALCVHDQRNFNCSSLEGCWYVREISISGRHRLTDDFIYSANPPEVVHGDGEVDVIFYETKLPVWLEQHGFSCQNQGREYSSSFWLTRQELIEASKLALGFNLSFKDRALLEVDITCKIIMEIAGKEIYSYVKEFRGLKSDIKWLRLLEIGEIVDNAVTWLRHTKQILVSVSLCLPTCNVELKDFGSMGLLIRKGNSRRLSLWADGIEYGDGSVEPYFSPFMDAENVWNGDSTDSEACSEPIYKEGPGECSRSNYYGDSDSSDEDFGGAPGSEEGTGQDPGNNGRDSEGGQQFRLRKKQKRDCTDE